MFVPLCGKTLDMIWLAEQGASVVGCELSDLAVQQFFTENSLQFSKGLFCICNGSMTTAYFITASTEKFTIYKATDKRITFLVGDMYDITSHDTGTFDVVWDCSSFGAINPEDRSKYYTVTKSLLRPSSRILMSCYDFDVSLHRSPPPPYPIVLDTVESYYGKDYSIAVLEKANVPGFPMLRCIYSMQEK